MERAKLGSDGIDLDLGCVETFGSVYGIVSESHDDERITRKPHGLFGAPRTP